MGLMQRRRESGGSRLCLGALLRERQGEGGGSVVREGLFEGGSLEERKMRRRRQEPMQQGGCQIRSRLLVRFRWYQRMVKRLEKRVVVETEKVVVAVVLGLVVVVEVPGLVVVVEVLELVGC